MPRRLIALLRSINHLFYESTSPENFATLFFADYDSATHRLRYVNCGHMPPFLIRAEVRVYWLRDGGPGGRPDADAPY